MLADQDERSVVLPKGNWYDFEKGKYTSKRLKVINGDGNIEKVHSKGPWTYGEISWKFMSD
jgi:hypothetical protein